MIFKRLKFVNGINSGNYKKLKRTINMRIKIIYNKHMIKK